MEMEEKKEVGSDDSSFIWDDTARLYFHAGSGFYHDPVAGWYYSSRDGLYYTFENGCYVLLQSNQANQHHEAESGEAAVGNTSDVKLEPLNVDGGNVEGRLCSGLVADDSDGFQHGIGEPLTTTGDTECGSSQEPEYPPPPSNWLEETLINLYLSGYNRVVDAPENSLDMDAGDGVYSSVAGEDINMTEEQERITKVASGLSDPHESIISEDISREEENWLDQYGQVIDEDRETLQQCSAVDLWDWTMVKYSKEDGKTGLARLVGRLVKPSAKLHPSVHNSGSRFRTAPISEVHLDLARVKTGQIYKLHNPSSQYLASLSTYDSSNPTKDWCFPQLSISADDGLPKSKVSKQLRSDSGAAASKSSSPSESKKERSHPYKDRAAERRKLHGGYGVGPGQKISSVSNRGISLPEEGSTDDVEIEAEAPSTPFGPDSYARKILEGMGWQEGEGLGSSRKGMVEPIQAVGNTGNAGLGWPKNNMRKHK
ncbi:SUPPRESSOR OF ABI3-5 [Linum grandiflorum]